LLSGDFIGDLWWGLRDGLGTFGRYSIRNRAGFTRMRFRSVGFVDRRETGSAIRHFPDGRPFPRLDRQHTIEDTPDVIRDRCPEAAQGLVDRGEPSFELREDAIQRPARSVSLAQILLERAGETLVRSNIRDRSAASISCYLPLGVQFEARPAFRTL
jgi:hypothetical protein